MTGQSHPGPAAAIRWEMDPEQATNLADILAMLEDFWRQASREAVDELAGYQTLRPLNPSIWADWLADYLGDQVLALRAATANPIHPSTTGDPT